jgi:transcriptional regulator with XRE-family HTH domain
MNWTPAKIRKLRIGLGLTQKDMGSFCGVSEGYIRELEKSRRNPSKTLQKIFDLIDCGALTP